MYRTFREFVNQQDNQKHFRNQLLHRLGLEDDSIPLRAVDQQKLGDALGSMDVDDETLNNIHAWLQKAPDSRLKDLINQFGGEQSDTGNDRQQGDKIMGTPAQLPPGPPRPKKPEQQPQMPVDSQAPQV